MILKFLKTSLRFREQIILWPENEREQKKIRLFNLEKKARDSKNSEASKEETHKKSSIC